MTTKTIQIDIDLLPCLESTSDTDSYFTKLTDKINSMVLFDNDVRNIVLRLSWETNPIENLLGSFQNWVYNLKSLFPSIKFFLICEAWFESYRLHEKLDRIDGIFYLEFCMLQVYHRLVQKNRSSIICDWNHGSNKILFLTGKSYKFNRIRLLYKLLQTDDLRRSLNYSLIVKPNEIQACRDLLPDINESEFQNLLSQQKIVGAWLSKTGIPYEQDIYSTALFQIISETAFDRLFNGPWCTEKTWLSIINHRPFIMAGEICTLNKLEALGFYTFRDLLAIPNYDDPDKPNFLEYGPLSSTQGSIRTTNEINNWRLFYEAVRDPSWPNCDSIEKLNQLPFAIRQSLQSVYRPPIENINDMRLDAIVQNSLFWLTNLSKHKEQISEMTKHNHSQFLRLGKQTCFSLESFLTENQIDLSVDQLIAPGDHLNRWYGKDPACQELS